MYAPSKRLMWQAIVLFFLGMAFMSGPLFAETTSVVDVPSSSLAFENYLKLRDVLPLYESAELNPWKSLSTRSLLKPGDRNHKIVLLRERLKQTHDLLSQNDFGGELFDVELKEAVELFQSRHGLKSDGIVGKNTISALNISPAERVKQIQINMARWGNLAGKLQDRYIMVNIPDYHLSVIENNKKIIDMKIIAGKPTWSTPEIFSTVTRLIVNPYWDVPDTIAIKEIIPKIQENPNYLDEVHLQVFANEEDYTHPLDPSRIDWYSAGNSYHFRQAPGEENSLGVVKFEFKNKYHVYLHDTPAKTLFEEDNRALSHGCIRLEKPLALADYLLTGNPESNDPALQDRISNGKTVYVNIPQPIPIIITYITAWVDDNGVLQFRKDIYQRDNQPITNASASSNDEEAY